MNTTSCPPFTSSMMEAHWRRITGECERLLSVKGNEYSGTVDRLGNFRRIAEDTGATPEFVLYVYMKKHWDSITSLVKHIEQQNSIPGNLSESAESRVVDIMNYAFLLSALLEARTTKEKQAGELFDTKTPTYDEILADPSIVGTRHVG